MATTLLSHAISLSTLSQHDTLLTYYLISQQKINLSSFIINHMIKTALYPSRLPYRLIISHIWEASNMSLEYVFFIVVKQWYNSKGFGSMSYVLVDDIWVPKSDGGSIDTSPL